LQGYNDGLTSLPQDDEYAEPRLSPALAAKEDFEDFEREAVTKQIFEEGLGLAGVALLKQACAMSHPTRMHASGALATSRIFLQPCQPECKAVTEQMIEESLSVAGMTLPEQARGSLMQWGL
jgi:hypothetical protein